MVAMAESTLQTEYACRNRMLSTFCASSAACYTFGSYIDEVLCMVKANGDRYYYSTNDLYSTYALTDSTGTVVERYMYDPYGRVTVLDGLGETVRTESAYGNPWTFTGRRLDQETGLMYFRNRMYEVGLGRFIERDPIGYRGGMLLYGAYFVPDSLDPLGLDRLGNGRILIVKTLHCLDKPRGGATACGIVMVGTDIEVERPGVPKRTVGIYFNWIPRPISRDCECCCPGSKWAWVQHINEGNGWEFDNSAGPGNSGAKSDPERKDPGGSGRKRQPVKPPSGATPIGSYPPETMGPGWIQKSRAERKKILDEERKWEANRWKQNPLYGGGPGPGNNPGPTTVLGDDPDSAHPSSFRTQLVCLSTGDVWFDYAWNKTGGHTSALRATGRGTGEVSAPK